ncbi:hypothetical protein AB7M49_004174 [Bradyrhizobium elkanii]
MACSRVLHSSLFPAFRPSVNSFRLLRRLLISPSRSRILRPLSLISRTRQRSPEVSSTAFPASPPNLPPRPLITMDFAISCLLVRSGRPRYPVLIHRAAGLLHASFRPHLAMTPLRFANLRRHQAGYRTFTSKLSNVLGTQQKSSGGYPPEAHSPGTGGSEGAYQADRSREGALILDLIDRRWLGGRCRTRISD